MGELIERISGIYNDCWKNYKQYLSDHDMEQYSLRSEKLLQKYDRQADIEGILFWWAGQVQGLHDADRRREYET